MDTNLVDISESTPPLEEIEGTEQERENEVIRRLKALEDEVQKKALILKNSHIGGHKFAGNVIVSSTSSFACFVVRS